jgi:amino acid transporter
VALLALGKWNGDGFISTGYSDHSFFDFADSLFLASGASVASAGPGGALIAYALIGIMVFFMMECLGEMATYLPISGSFNNYAGRFIDPAIGFSLGWNYFYNWSVTLAVELVRMEELECESELQNRILNLILFLFPFLAAGF